MFLGKLFKQLIIILLLRGGYLDFKIQKEDLSTSSNYKEDSINIGYEFTKKINKELGEFLKAVVIFGSAARKKEDAADIDLLIIVDDVSVKFTPELSQTYRVIVEKTARSVNRKIHVTSMRFTSFWEYVRVGDPVAMNILRDGHALFDTGFFEPVQALLLQGRLKPSSEAMWAYFNRSPDHLRKSRVMILEACMDLYWAVIDSTHAALMSIEEAPPSPSHAANVFEHKLVNKGFFKQKHVWTIRKFYDLSKRISHRELRVIPGKDYDSYYKEAVDFVNDVSKFLEKK